MGVRSLTANLSTAGFAEDTALGFSVPFGGWGWTRVADGVDLSEDAGATSTAFFLSLTGCGGMGVEGRGEGAAVFCVVRGQDGLAPTFGGSSPWTVHSQEPKDVLAS
jgi:hypothetical protein